MPHNADTYRNPDVMVPWCEAVGLDPTRVLVSDFEIRHTSAEGEHVALYTLMPPPEPGQVVNHDGPAVRCRLVVAVLPQPCSSHPAFPVIAAYEESIR